MEHDDEQQKIRFSSAAAKLGLLSYVILGVLVAIIFLLG